MRLTTSSSWREAVGAVLGLSTALAVGLACTAEDPVTPTCTHDVDESGIVPTQNGCNPYPPCDDPVACCTTAQNEADAARAGGDTTVDFDFGTCLLGYGVDPSTLTGGGGMAGGGGTGGVGGGGGGGAGGAGGGGGAVGGGGAGGG